MKFVNLTKKEYETLLSNTNPTNFYQDLSWLEFQSNLGHTCHILGIKDNNKVLAGAIFIENDAILKNCTFTCPGGILIDYQNKEILEFFLTNLKKYMKKHHTLEASFNPYIPYNDNIISTLENLKAKKIPSEIKEHSYLKTDISLDTFSRNISPLALDKINECNKYSLETIPVTLNNIDNLYEIIKESDIDISLDYLTKLYETLKPLDKIEIFLTKFSYPKYISNLEEEISVLKEENTLINNDTSSKKNLTKIVSLENKISDLKEEQSTEGKVINLGATILLKTNNTVTSYLTLSNKAFPQFDITYYLYYQDIKYAINNEFNIFNLGTVANEPLKVSFNTLNYFLMPEFILKNNKILAYLNKYHK